MGSNHHRRKKSEHTMSECKKKFQTADTVALHSKRPFFQVRIGYKCVPYLFLSQEAYKIWHHLKAKDNDMSVPKLSTLHNVIVCTETEDLRIFS